MSLKSLISGGLGTFAEKAAGIADRFIHSKDEQAEFTLEMEKLAQAQGSELEQTMRAELGVKERVMVAELTSGDNYTKRARPTLVYFGMVVIFLNYVLFPKLSIFFPDHAALLAPIDLPAEFWLAWGGVTGVWSIGRTMERRGAKNNLVNIISGKTPSLID